MWRTSLIIFEEQPLSSACKTKAIIKICVLKGNRATLDVPANIHSAKRHCFMIQYNQAARLLLEKGADVNQKYASAAEIENILEYPKEIYHTQRTPLMHAAQHADVKMLGLLLEKKSHLEDLDEVGFNALDYAIYGENKENVAFLQSLNLTTNKSAHQFRKRIASLVKIVVGKATKNLAILFDTPTPKFCMESFLE